MTQLVAVIKSPIAVSKLPGVYCEETQIMNCYLYMITNYANVTYNHKYYVVNAWAIICGFWFHSNLSLSLKSEFVTQIWGKTELSPTIRHKISINRLFVSKPSIVFDYTGIGILVSGGHLSHYHCYGDSSERIEHYKYSWGILCRVYV